MQMRKRYKKAVRKAAGIMLALMLAMSLAACGSGSGSAAAGTNGESASADENTSAEEAASPGEGASAGQPQEAAEDDEGDLDIDIPEIPYEREDGGVSLNVFAMDTYMTLLAYGDRAEEAVLAAAAEIHRLDDMLSTGDPESEISLLNAAGSGYVSEVVSDLVEKSEYLYTETGGLFDIAIYPVVKLWGFPTQEYRVPAKEEIQEALKLADASAIKVEEGGADAADVSEETSVAEETAAAAAVGASAEFAAAAPAAEAVTGAARISFGMEDMEIDLGGIAKGYTSSRVMEIYREYGIEHGLVSLGGNVQATGNKENGNPWRVAIQNPEEEQGLRLSEIWGMIWSNKWWYVISVGICLFFAVLYIYKTPKTYSRSEKIILDQMQSQRALSDLTQFTGSSAIRFSSADVYNEMEAFSSPDLMQQVVERLGYQARYTEDQFMRKRELYTSTPFELVLAGDNVLDFSLVPFVRFGEENG